MFVNDNSVSDIFAFFLSYFSCCPSDPSSNLDTQSVSGESCGKAIEESREGISGFFRGVLGEGKGGGPDTLICFQILEIKSVKYAIIF